MIFCIKYWNTGIKNGIFDLTSTPPATRWSQCSKDELQRSFDIGLDYCLHNVPETIYDSTPDCGNGIVDQGEECDCGNAPATVRSFFTCIIIIIIIISIIIVFV